MKEYYQNQLNQLKRKKVTIEDDMNYTLSKIKENKNDKEIVARYMEMYLDLHIEFNRVEQDISETEYHLQKEVAYA